MTRMSPIPEDMDLSNPEVARRVWDPYHRDAFVERQAKIRGCLDLATVLLTVPDFYRGVLQSLWSDLYVRLDELDTVTRRKSKYEALKVKGDIPFHYNSMK